MQYSNLYNCVLDKHFKQGGDDWGGGWSFLSRWFISVIEFVSPDCVASKINPTSLPHVVMVISSSYHGKHQDTKKDWGKESWERHGDQTIPVWVNSMEDAQGHTHICATGTKLNLYMSDATSRLKYWVKFSEINNEIQSSACMGGWVPALILQWSIAPETKWHLLGWQCSFSSLRRSWRASSWGWMHTGVCYAFRDIQKTC